MDTETSKKGNPTPIDPDAARRADRRAIYQLRRQFDGEDVNFLNITAMMDMMTILLVFMIKSFTATTENVTSDQLTIPGSQTADEMSESVAVTITKNALLLDGSPVVGVKRGDVDPSEKSGGDANELIITRLLDQLKERAEFYKKIAQLKKKPFEGALTIIADKDTPFRLLSEVIYTSGQAEFSKYRLIVLNKKEE